jgi:hypothetical protein
MDAYGNIGKPLLISVFVGNKHEFSLDAYSYYACKQNPKTEGSS